MKTLKFVARLAPLILSGEKTTTWRLFDDKNLQKNDQLQFIITESGEKFAQAEITNIYEKKLSEVRDVDYNGHEKYTNHKEMLDTFTKFYGPQVNKDTIVKIIHFKITSK